LYKTCTAFALLLILACTGPKAPAPGAQLRVSDDLGRTVALPGPARRVLSLAPSNTELVFALGAGDRLVGRTDACDFPAGAAAIPSVGSLFPPDHERILATAPTLVLMIEGNVPLRTWLESHGLPVLVLQPRTLEGIYVSTERLGRALGAVPDATALVRTWRARAARIRARIPAGPAPTVFYEVWPDPLSSAGPGTYVGDLIRLAGGANVIDAALGDWPRLPTERLVLADPQVVLTPHRDTPARAHERPGWAGLRAVRAGRVHLLSEPALLARPGPRALDGLAWLVDTLHGARP
jgi:iron complex transport system substrate-binding protein